MGREMKDSGVPWVGQVPNNWEVKRGKAILTLLEREVQPDDGVITCFRDGEVTLRSKRREDGFTISLQENGYQGIEPGDLVVHGMDGFAGAIGISDSRGKGTPVLNVLDSSQHKPFLKYYLRNMAYTGVFLSLSTGIRVRSCDTNWNKIKTLPYAFPPVQEQIKIANFLDQKCAEIDAVLEKTCASIEEYKKLKQAVITQAVTKGIRGDRPMKKSGVEWAGAIPEEVKVSRLGLHYDIILGKMLCSTKVDDTYTLEPYYCAADVHFEGISDNERKVMWFSPSEKELYLVKKHDLLVVEGGAGAGGCAIVVDGEIPTYIQNSIMIVRPKCSGDCRYVRYLLECFVKQGYIDVVCNKATIPHFTKDKLSAMPYFAFSEQERSEIADYLDAQCKKINVLIRKKEQSLAELKDYKKSLIYEYVTGKKEAK